MNNRFVVGLNVATFLVAVSVLVILLHRQPRKPSTLLKHQGASSSTGKCSKEACGAIDPVNDPAYNMKNVVKQSILLEEHLAEKNKYCISCIIKHFMHIIGLVEEAVWLAGPDVNKYPMLASSADFYQRQFDTWSAKRKDDATIREVLGAIREHRRELIESYFLEQ